MKKTYLAAIMAAGLTTGTFAMAKFVPNQLVTVIPGGCSIVEDVVEDVTLNNLEGAWSWITAEGDSSGQTKFGGDAEFTVTASYEDEEDGTITEEFEVELEVVRFDPDAPMEEFAGKFAYACEADNYDEETNPFHDTYLSGACTGTAYDLVSALTMAAAEYLEIEDPEAVTLDDYSLNGVMVKAMNPGMGTKRQNYPKVDICDVPPPPAP